MRRNAALFRWEGCSVAVRYYCFCNTRLLDHKPTVLQSLGSEVYISHSVVPNLAVILFIFFRLGPIPDQRPKYTETRHLRLYVFIASACNMYMTICIKD
jgi:hypothetical protein